MVFYRRGGGTAELSKMVVVGLRGQSLMAEVPHQELQLQLRKGSGPHPVHLDELGGRTMPISASYVCTIA